MDKKTAKNLTSPCGLPCFHCVAYMATTNPEIRKKVSEALNIPADKAYYPHNTKMYQLCMMKKLGFEKWIEEEAQKIWDTYRTKPFDFDNILY